MFKMIKAVIVDFANFETALLKLKTMLPTKDPDIIEIMKLAQIAVVLGYTVKDYDKIVRGARK